MDAGTRERPEDIRRRTEFALEAYRQTQEIIRFFDQKAAAGLLMLGLLFTAFVDLARDHDLSPGASLLPWVLLIVGALFVLALIVQAWILLALVISPRSARHYSADELSLLYFEHIAQVPRAQLPDRFADLDEPAILRTVLDQLHELSLIAKAKQDSIARCVRLFFASVALLGVFAVLVSICG
jgi:hypothetical protein